MKNKQYHNVGTVPRLNRQIVERNKIDTPKTEMHDLSLSWHGTYTSIKKGGAKLVI